MVAPVSPYTIFQDRSSDGSGSLICTASFNGVWTNGNPYTSLRVQNTSDQVCHVVFTTPQGAVLSGPVPAGFNHTFTQAQLGGWSLGDGATLDNVTWT